MARAFADIAFTPSVKAARSRYGSRRANERMENAKERGDELTEEESEFIEARDDFYQATVSETGWPFSFGAALQFRGGPRGFLKVIDSKTVGYADFRGNVQYVSVGNLNSDGRIALILMDYPNRRRLKIWGNARVVHESDEPAVPAALRVEGYKARIERAVIILVAAFDRNCPQHITPRFTEAEVQAAIAPLIAELESMRHAS